MKHFRSLLLMLLLLLALCVGVSAKNECRLYDMTLKTESGEALDHISKGYFWASVSAKKTGDLNATILLATYDSAGRYLGLYTMRANVPTGTVYELGALVDNAAGKIAALKAFAVDSLSGAVRWAVPLNMESVPTRSRPAKWAARCSAGATGRRNRPRRSRAITKMFPALIFVQNVA